ncbi:hypothetical protein CEN46_13705 [Fischerella thermalis CCMEE 5318]|uniref:Uncharacterized protein n=1 Tax=Fischerella thermalis CCMEE 5318 TaxID=2019666 RepID=A0A2N6LEK0_9CYAN|nr:hypothetical protein CEN46_13705 [Fischerella thermalis CCMEE 5318]
MIVGSWWLIVGSWWLMVYYSTLTQSLGAHDSFFMLGKPAHRPPRLHTPHTPHLPTSAPTSSLSLAFLV